MLLIRAEQKPVRPLRIELLEQLEPLKADMYLCMRCTGRHDLGKLLAKAFWHEPNVERLLDACLKGLPNLEAGMQSVVLHAMTIQ